MPTEIRLKVCCIKSVEEAMQAISHGAAALGLVAEMPSGPGVIDDHTIASIARTVPPGVETFLLTSRTDPAGVVEHVIKSGVTTVQLVDAVDARTYAALREKAPRVRIVQVIHVEDDIAIEEALDVEKQVDALLLDSGRPRAAIRELGGTGRTHDWSVSRRIVERARVPVFLAGGLNAGNVGGAIREVSPWGIDLCSGVRTNGALDGAKLAGLVAALGADAVRWNHTTGEMR
jgi:phosphoribosylanthranilate isomerase